MLVLTRRVGQRIMIGPDIVITLVQVNKHDKKVRIGIDAPKEVLIQREELIPIPPKPEGGCL